MFRYNIQERYQFIVRVTKNYYMVLYVIGIRDCLGRTGYMSDDPVRRRAVLNQLKILRNNEAVKVVKRLIEQRS